MAKEKTLNDPLSGAEIKEIATCKFREALDRDCTLTDDKTYPGFHLKFEATISYLRQTAEQPTMMWGETAVGEYRIESPNQAREDHDLPIPVVVQTPTGEKREKVKFMKREAYAAKPK